MKRVCATLQSVYPLLVFIALLSPGVVQAESTVPTPAVKRVAGIKAAPAPKITPEVPLSPWEVQLAQEEEHAVAPEDTASADRFSLKDCLEYAFKHNFQIREAKAREQAAHGAFIEARAAQYPSVDANAQYNQVEKSSIPTMGGQQFSADKSWNSSVLLNQNIYSGNRITSRVEQAQYLERASTLDRETIEQDVIRAVKQGFYDVLLADAGIKVRKGAVQLLEEELALERSRLAAGTVSDFNVIRAEAELSNARTPLIRARNALRINLEQLAQTIGLPRNDATHVRAAIKLKGELTEPIIELDLPLALSLAEQRRPELQTLRMRYLAAQRGVIIARSGYLPTVSGNGGYGIQNSPFSNSLSDTYEGWQFSVLGQWTIFDSFATKGRIVQAEAQESELAVSLERTKQEVMVQVRRAMSQVVEARELVAASRKAIEQADESYRLATARAQVGAAPQIDVLDTQVALTQARTNHVEALHSLNTALAELNRSTGEPVANQGA